MCEGGRRAPSEDATCPNPASFWKLRCLVATKQTSRRGHPTRYCSVHSSQIDHRDVAIILRNAHSPPPTRCLSTDDWWVGRTGTGADGPRRGPCVCTCILIDCMTVCIRYGDVIRRHPSDETRQKNRQTELPPLQAPFPLIWKQSDPFFFRLTFTFVSKRRVLQGACTNRSRTPYFARGTQAFSPSPR